MERENLNALKEEELNDITYSCEGGEMMVVLVVTGKLGCCATKKEELSVY
jgi:hypothetical protein